MRNTSKRSTPAQIIAAMSATMIRRALDGHDTTDADLMREGFTPAEVTDYGVQAHARTRQKHPKLWDRLNEAA